MPTIHKILGSRGVNGGAVHFLWTSVESIGELSLPILITPSVKFDRTPVTKIAGQRDFFGTRVGAHRFERHPAVTLKQNGSTTDFISLDPQNFRYYCFVSEGYKAGHEAVEIAGLMEPPLHFSHFLYSDEPFGQGREAGYGHAMHIPQVADEGVLGWSPIKLTLNYFSDLSSLISSYEMNRDKFALIQNSVRLYGALSLIPQTHSLRFIGAMAVLECVLCHKPKISENADSINHQIKTKLALLSSRPSANIPIVPALSLDKLWSALYKLRSQIAHGDSVILTPKFPFPRLEEATAFAERTCRAVIRQLINEPELISDLKEV